MHVYRPIVIPYLCLFYCFVDISMSPSVVFLHLTAPRNNSNDLRMENIIVNIFHACMNMLCDHPFDTFLNMVI